MIEKTASTVTPPNTAIFRANFAAIQSEEPAITASDFTFFINDVKINPAAITSFTNSANNICTLNVNVGVLGYTLLASDVIVAVGRFQ